MGKSYKKHDINGHGRGSDKYDKRIANRKLRTKTKRLLRQNPEMEILPLIREVSNVWDFVKDGKGYFGNMLKGNECRYPHKPCSENEYFIKCYRELKGK